MTDKNKKESKKTEQYENPYFGKKKPTSPDLSTWDVTKNYTGKEKKSKLKNTKFYGYTNTKKY